MKLVMISDTHGLKPNLPDGDVLIHAGDLTGNGSVREMGLVLNWLESLPFQHKVVIAGNHDFFCEENDSLTKSWMREKGIHYLHDSGIEIDGIKFWGSPYQPWFYDWAFNKRRGEEIKKHWDLIPGGIDVLITHGPPHGILDTTVYGEHVGCEDLLDVVIKIKPKVHVFGHIHESNGWKMFNDIHFINASIVDREYKISYVPVVMDI